MVGHNYLLRYWIRDLDLERCDQLDQKSFFLNVEKFSKNHRTTAATKSFLLWAISLSRSLKRYVMLKFHRIVHKDYRGFILFCIGF